MSLTFQTLFTNKNPRSSHTTLSRTHFLKSSNFACLIPNSKIHFPDSQNFLTHNHLLYIEKVKASFQEPFETARKQDNSNGGIGGEYNFDALLSVLEFLCLASSAMSSIYFAVIYGTQKGVVGWLGSKILVWQCVVLVSGVVVGAVIRRRQWRRICGVGLSRASSSGVNLLERVEKVEEAVRSSSTIIRVLSRQLEKLGNRFRVNRKALKEPVAESAALAQKNSEAIRSLSVHGDILEKELSEIQKVLLAMQEQQQKQLELILAIGKTGKLRESKRVTNQDQNALDASNLAVDGASHFDTNQLQTLARKKESQQ
ncbi:uncharacterized protein LOC111408097 isoform X1 [Olea europaea var. sylvestris]|uniref:uncharacterized protein LOC111408097 isoform X1 n=1 Tax=Olea europaea var. sylvestris TaxID=158386 RepID=UPI000C1D0F5F|nr:uncharacterized protein LOC111408097 isoform X1 [Olea europaea var. sylvestris]